MIGEYISNRNNLQILEAFVKMFDFTETRIDEALRQYLETFRLPGEAPLISLLMEHFAEHWHVSVLILFNRKKMIMNVSFRNAMGNHSQMQMLHSH